MPNQETLDRVFLNIAKEISQFSNCVSYQVGSIIVKDNRIISMGYNGTAMGFTNCNEVFPKENFDRDEHHKFSMNYELHSELNSILWAAKNGIAIGGCTLYCTLQPCSECIKNICQSGIKRIVYSELYDKVTYSDDTIKMLTICHIELVRVGEFCV
jgi:dCMP deaminase